jgi:hypothetical protein
MPSSGIYMQLKGNNLKTTLWNPFSTPKVNLEHSFSLSNPSLLPAQNTRKRREIARSRLALVRIE